MANSVYGHFFLSNNEMIPITSISTLPQEGIYEVLRVIKFVPLFWKDHFARLKHSAQLAGFLLNMSEYEFVDKLSQLIQANQIAEGNIRISISSQQQLLLYYIPHAYPNHADYRNGVDVGLLQGERVNPQAKIVQQGLREATNLILQEKGFYEVLLINNEGLVTEGSRTNVFFVKGDQFVTPLPEQVLLGITRQKVMECIYNQNLCVLEQTISLNDLAGFDAAFLTGTSPKVLPIRQIEDIGFNPTHPEVQKLIEIYNQYIESDISQNQSFFRS